MVEFLFVSSKRHSTVWKQKEHQLIMGFGTMHVSLSKNNNIKMRMIIIVWVLLFLLGSGLGPIQERLSLFILSIWIHITVFIFTYRRSSYVYLVSVWSVEGCWADGIVVQIFVTEIVSINRKTGESTFSNIIIILLFACRWIQWPVSLDIALNLHKYTCKKWIK